MSVLPQQRAEIKKQLRKQFKPAVVTTIMGLIDQGVCRVTYERGVVKVHTSKDKQRFVEKIIEGMGE